jgi:hypothetical protein
MIGYPALLCAFSGPRRELLAGIAAARDLVARRV